MIVCLREMDVYNAVEELKLMKMRARRVTLCDRLKQTGDKNQLLPGSSNRRRSSTTRQFLLAPDIDNNLSGTNVDGKTHRGCSKMSVLSESSEDTCLSDEADDDDDGDCWSHPVKSLGGMMMVSSFHPPTGKHKSETQKCKQ